MQELLVLDKPEQLKALGHPLRVRALEMLGDDDEGELTNRELAQRLGVDPGHLHFHVRMLLKAGLIELIEHRKGREKPYRAVARTFRVSPELLATGRASDIQAAILEEVQRGLAAHGAEGKFRSAQLELSLDLDEALELIMELMSRARARDAEDERAGQIVITAFAHPPTSRVGDAG
jgi:DNA-binding transcriptional ArsR family regulator